MRPRGNAKAWAMSAKRTGLRGKRDWDRWSKRNPNRSWKTDHKRRTFRRWGRMKKHFTAGYYHPSNLR